MNRAKLMEDLENARQFTQQMEAQVASSNQVSVDILKQLKDGEIEIETLKRYISGLKQRVTDEPRNRSISP